MNLKHLDNNKYNIQLKSPSAPQLKLFSPHVNWKFTFDFCFTVKRSMVHVPLWTVMKNVIFMHAFHAISIVEVYMYLRINQVNFYQAGTFCNRLCPVKFSEYWNVIDQYSCFIFPLTLFENTKFTEKTEVLLSNLIVYRRPLILLKININNYKPLKQSWRYLSV